MKYFPNRINRITTGTNVTNNCDLNAFIFTTNINNLLNKIHQVEFNGSENMLLTGYNRFISYHLYFFSFSDG